MVKEEKKKKEERKRISGFYKKDSDSVKGSKIRITSTCMHLPTPGRTGKEFMIPIRLSAPGIDDHSTTSMC